MQQLDTHSGPEPLLTKAGGGGKSGWSPAHDRPPGAPPNKTPPAQPAVEVRQPKPPNGPAGGPKRQQQKSADEESIDYDSSLENTSVSSFDFNRERANTGGQQQRAVNMGTLHKAGPSKWEDAEKWLSSDRNSKPKMQQLVSSIPSHVIINASKKAALLGRMGIGLNGSGGVLDFLSEPDSSTKKVDAVRFSFMPSPGNGGMAPPTKARSMSSLDRYPLEELLSCEEAEGTALAAGGKLKVVSTLCDTDEDMSKPAIGRTEKPTCDSDHRLQEPGKIPSAGPCAAPPPGLRSVSMRDMGTEMTPIASQEPSRTGTPLRATTPTRRSPVCSGPSTPNRPGVSQQSQSQSQSQSLPDHPEEGEAAALSEKQLQASKTRQEILALGTQLGKANIAAWASREEEEEDASRCLKNIDLGEVKKNVVEARAAAWEEAEKAKYEARYKREEAKIIAWENHERAKAEAEMKRIEVKVERMRSHAHEQLMNKLALARRRAEELRAAAESRRVEQAAKAAERAEYIRQTGSLPPPSLSSSSPLTALLRLCC